MIAISSNLLASTTQHGDDPSHEFFLGRQKQLGVVGEGLFKSCFVILMSCHYFDWLLMMTRIRFGRRRWFAGEQMTLTTGVASGLLGQQRIPIGNPLLPVHPVQFTLPVHHLLSGHGV